MSLRQLLSFAAMAALLSSCAKVQEDRAAVPDMSVCYQVVSTTKAASAYPENRPFVSWAWYLPDGRSWTQGSGEAQLYIPGETVSYDEALQVWTTATAYYWPKSGSLTFMSLSPAELAGNASCSPDKGIELSFDVAANPDVDLMVADIAADRRANDVPTIFRHKLAKVVSFTMKTDRDYGTLSTVGGKRFTLNRISLAGVYTSGTYASGNSTVSGPKEGWSGHSGGGDMVWYDESEIEIEITHDGKAVPGKDGELFVLPQSFGPDAVLIVEYTIETHIAGTGPNHQEKVTESVRLSELHSSWEMNRQISYTLTIGLDSIEWEASAEEWQDRDGGDITV